MRSNLTQYFKAAGVLAIVVGSFAFTGKPAEHPNKVYQGGTALKGKELMAKSDCMACHAVDNKIVGPGFKEIATKYKGDKTATAKLADKVINGGAGAWGDIPMSPHPQLSKADATEMVTYILSLAPGAAAPTKPAAPKKAVPAKKPAPKKA